MVKKKPKDAMPEKAGFRGRVRSAILGLIAGYRMMMKPWDSAKRLFNYHSIDGVLEKALPDAEMRLAIEVFILAGLITFIMSLAYVVGSAYIENAELATVHDTTGVALPSIMMTTLFAPILLFFIIFVPVSILVSLALQYCAFRVLRTMDGRATFTQHIYLSSVVTLAAALVTGLYIFFPIPCLGLLGGICFIATNLYLGMIVAGRAYSIAHRIGPIPGFDIALVVADLNIAIILFLANALEG